MFMRSLFWGLCGVMLISVERFLPRVTQVFKIQCGGYYSRTVLDLKQMWRYVSECSLFQNPWVVLSDCDDVVFYRLFVVLLFSCFLFFCTALFCVLWMTCGWVWSTCSLCPSMAVGNRGFSSCFFLFLLYFI